MKQVKKESFIYQNYTNLYPNENTRIRHFVEKTEKSGDSTEIQALEDIRNDRWRKEYEYEYTGVPYKMTLTKDRQILKQLLK